MKKKGKDKAVKNVSEVTGKSWVVRFNKNGVKVHKTFAYDPSVKNDRAEAYQQAVAWRNNAAAPATVRRSQSPTASVLDKTPSLSKVVSAISPLSVRRSSSERPPP